jgi:hypothetical protein
LEWEFSDAEKMKWPIKISVDLRRQESGLLAIIAIILLGIYLLEKTVSAAGVIFVTVGVVLSVVLILVYVFYGGREEDY